MTPKGGWLRSPRSLFCLALLSGLALVGAWAWHGASRTRPVSGPELAGWDVPRLVQRLDERGVRVRCLSSSAHYPSRTNAYLTTTDLSFAQIDRLPKRLKDVERLWEGTLYCQAFGDPEARDRFAEQWAGPDGPPVVGPFVFFGDRKLLARVRAALADEP